MATGNQSFTGTTGDDVFIGAAGVDTVTTNIGTDIVLTSSGDDAITVDGVGNKTIDGGAGTDSLTINVSGNTSLGSYAITRSGDYYVLTDSSSNVIQYKNINSLTVGSYTYIEDTDNDTFWNATEKVLYMYDGGGWSNDKVEGLSGFSASDNLSVVGSNGNDYMNLFVNRSSELTGNMTLSFGEGNDDIGSGLFKNSDSVDMGAGNDGVSFVNHNTTYQGAPALSALSMTKLDGGAGTDSLSFTYNEASIELNLSFAGATNFENITGSGAAEVIRGDTGANQLSGNDGADTIYGGSGNDFLGGQNVNSAENASQHQARANDTNRTDNDTLYGEAGDDVLVGSYGDDTLDGGTGADTIYSGGGSDTIVLRVGDGGSTLAAADTIADFTDGSDTFGLDDGLTYLELTIAQGSGDYASHSLISITATSEYLAVIENTLVDNLTAFDFVEIV
jgi:Ca2+-binding RTX toxin-like protein